MCFIKINTNILAIEHGIWKKGCVARWHRNDRFHGNKNTLIIINVLKIGGRIISPIYQ